MIETKDLLQALEGAGSLADRAKAALMAAYGERADLHYELGRYSAGLTRFVEAFPDARAVSVARAPGRVNLIGEHTGCSGFPTMHMAIERDIVVFFSPRKDRRVNLINKSRWYPPRRFEIARRIRPYGTGNWGNYAKAAAQALQEAVPVTAKGIDACVTGDIPAGSGLSSSSALVAAVAVALAEANGIRMDRTDLAGLLAHGERYVGTEAPGADQAASLLSERGKALKIDFNPLSTTPVPLPPAYSVVVCNSLAAAERAAAARHEHNRRLVECRLGTAMLNKMLAASRSLAALSELSHLPVQEQSQLISHIPNDPLSLREASKHAGQPARALRENVLKLKTGEILDEPRDGFKIAGRVRHVVSEGRRVKEAARALEEGDVSRFGELMNESHESCARDYEMSTPELDKLVEICREEGALGARLTGAGFGGCAIALVCDHDLPDFVSAIISRYYNDYLQGAHEDIPMSTLALEDAIFPCKPCGAAGLLL